MKAENVQRQHLKELRDAKEKASPKLTQEAASPDKRNARKSINPLKQAQTSGKPFSLEKTPGSSKMEKDVQDEKGTVSQSESIKTTEVVEQQASDLKSSKPDKIENVTPVTDGEKPDTSMEKVWETIRRDISLVGDEEEEEEEEEYGEDGKEEGEVDDLLMPVDIDATPVEEEEPSDWEEPDLEEECDTCVDTEPKKVISECVLISSDDEASPEKKQKNNTPSDEDALNTNTDENPQPSESVDDENIGDSLELQLSEPQEHEGDEGSTAVLDSEAHDGDDKEVVEADVDRELEQGDAEADDQFEEHVDDPKEEEEYTQLEDESENQIVDAVQEEEENPEISAAEEAEEIAIEEVAEEEEEVAIEDAVEEEEEEIAIEDAVEEEEEIPTEETEENEVDDIVEEEEAQENEIDDIVEEEDGEAQLEGEVEEVDEERIASSQEQSFSDNNWEVVDEAGEEETEDMIDDTPKSEGEVTATEDVPNNEGSVEPGEEAMDAEAIELEGVSLEDMDGDIGEAMDVTTADSEQIEDTVGGDENNENEVEEDNNEDNAEEIIDELTTVKDVDEEKEDQSETHTESQHHTTEDFANDEHVSEDKTIDSDQIDSQNAKSKDQVGEKVEVAVEEEVNKKELMELKINVDSKLKDATQEEEQKVDLKSVDITNYKTDNTIKDENDTKGNMEFETHFNDLVKNKQDEKKDEASSIDLKVAVNKVEENKKCQAIEVETIDLDITDDSLENAETSLTENVIDIKKTVSDNSESKKEIDKHEDNFCKDVNSEPNIKPQALAKPPRSRSPEIVEIDLDNDEDMPPMDTKPKSDPDGQKNTEPDIMKKIEAVIREDCDEKHSVSDNELKDVKLLDSGDTKVKCDLSEGGLLLKDLNDSSDKDGEDGVLMVSMESLSNRKRHLSKQSVGHINGSSKRPKLDLTNEPVEEAMKQLDGLRKKKLEDSFPKLKLTKEILNELISRRITEHINNSHKTLFAELKGRCDALEKVAEKWKKKAQALQSSINELNAELSKHQKKPRVPTRTVGINVRISSSEPLKPLSMTAPKAPEPLVKMTTPAPVSVGVSLSGPVPLQLVANTASPTKTLSTPTQPVIRPITTTAPTSNVAVKIIDLTDDDESALLRNISRPTLQMTTQPQQHIPNFRSVPSSTILTRPSGPLTIQTTAGAPLVGMPVPVTMQLIPTTPVSTAGMTLRGPRPVGNMPTNLPPPGTRVTTYLVPSGPPGVGPPRQLVPISAPTGVMPGQPRPGTPMQTFLLRMNAVSAPVSSTFATLTTSSNMMQSARGPPNVTITPRNIFSQPINISQQSLLNPLQRNVSPPSLRAPNPPTNTVVIPLTHKHPAPYPAQPVYAPNPQAKCLPPKPALKISKVNNGIVLSWNLTINSTHEEISKYQLFAYQEGTGPPLSSLWKKVGDVKALPLPMACTLTQFVEGNKYHFAVRAVDKMGRFGPYSEPSSIMLSK